MLPNLTPDCPGITESCVTHYFLSVGALHLVAECDPNVPLDTSSIGHIKTFVSVFPETSRHANLQKALNDPD